MLSIVWPQNIIKTFIESVGAIAEECKITFKQDGLVANVIDPAYVCFIGVEIPSEKFDSYEVEGNGVG
jgi:DNA polymerase III sliding clamp (beta) subunit (PCNA family)